ncbi:unnamed protein product, partial [Prorocentrum cordatum]
GKRRQCAKKNPKGKGPRMAERFRHAMHSACQDLADSRICVTLLEAAARHEDWVKEEGNRVVYYDPLLVSHAQLQKVVRGYFEQLEGGAEAQAQQQQQQYSQLRSRQQQQQEEVAALQHELDQVTLEANRRIEKGNETILKLKADLRQLRDATEPQVLREHEQARRRLEAARGRADALAREVRAPEGGPEVKKLRDELQVLESQKAALLEMVQGVYGQKKQAVATGDLLAQAPSASGNGAGSRLLLPDPRPGATAGAASRRWGRPDSGSAVLSGRFRRWSINSGGMLGREGASLGGQGAARGSEGESCIGAPSSSPARPPPLEGGNFAFLLAFSRVIHAVELRLAAASLLFELLAGLLIPEFGVEHANGLPAEVKQCGAAGYINNVVQPLCWSGV